MTLQFGDITVKTIYTNFAENLFSLFPTTSSPHFLFNICQSAATLDLELLSNMLIMMIGYARGQDKVATYKNPLLGKIVWSRLLDIDIQPS